MKDVNKAAVFSTYAGCLLGLCLFSVPASTQPIPRATVLVERPDVQRLSPQVKSSIGALSAASTQPVGLNVNRQSGTVVHVQGQFKTGATDPSAAARAFLQQYGGAFRTSPDLSGLSFGKASRVGNIQQVAVTPQYKGLPIFLSGLVVSVDQSGSVISTCGNVPIIKPVGTAARITAATAVGIVERQFGIPATAHITPRLGVLDTASLLGRDAAPQLVWGFQLDTEDSRRRIFIDATTGKVALATALPATIVTTTNPTSGGTTVTTGGGDTNPCIDQSVPEYHLNPATGVPDFIAFGPAGLWLPESLQGVPENVALAFFARYPLVFGTGDVPNQLRVVEVRRDAQGPPATHVVLQQMYGGFEVYGAVLNVHLGPSLAITSISGNYVRDPAVLLVPSTSESAADNTAAVAMAAERFKKKFGIDPNPLGGGWLFNPHYIDYIQILSQARIDAKYKSMLVFPGQLNAKHPLGNHLAYRFQFPEADVFVSGATGQIVAVMPNGAGANRLVYDAKTLPELTVSPYTLILKDGSQVGPSPFSPDVRPADAFISGTLGFYAGLGRTSYDNNNSAVNAITNSVFATFTNCGAVAFFDFIRREMFFCPGDITGDILAHEFTHGVTLTSAGLFYLDESGAVNEHYSDVMGNLAFPDATIVAGKPTWLMGEGSAAAGACGNIRNMANPAASCSGAQPGNYAAYRPRAGTCATLTGVIAPGCDFGGVHTNSGIGNLAAVLLSDGQAGSGHSGIGRPLLAATFHDTLTKRLHPWSTYIDERNNTWESVRDFALSGFAVPNPTGAPPTLSFTLANANEVSWAYNMVGVDPRLESGWFEVGGGLLGGRGTRVFYGGQTLSGGATVADVELVVRGISPVLGNFAYWEGRSRVLCAPGAPAGCVPGGAVTFPGTPGSPAIFGARITAHGIGTTAEPVTVSYFHSGFLPLDIGVNIITSAPLPMRTESVTGTFSHSAVIVGGKGNDTVNAGTTVTGAPDCTLDDVQVDVLKGDGTVVASASLGAAAVGSAGFPSWGASIVSDGKGTTSAATTVHWWFDTGVAVRYRVHYFMISPSGGSCSVP